MNPHAIVEIEGFPFHFDSWKVPRLFSRLNVELTTGECSQATWEVFDPDFRFLNKCTKDGGVQLSTVRVWVGFGPDLREPVFKGLLARVQRGQAKTTFVAYDMGFKMRLVKRSEYHKGDELAIIAKLAQRNGLQFKGPATPLKLEPHKAMAQDQQTDFEHCAELAHDAGLLLWVREDTLFADYPAKIAEKPKLTLVNRKDFQLLRDFDLTFKVPENKGGRPRGIEVRGRARGGKRLSGSSDRNKRGHDELRLKKDLAMHTQQRATARAQAQKELDREHAFSLSVRTLPTMTPDRRIDVRDTIGLVEVGDLFGGDYLVDRVTYDLTPGKLTTGLELHRDVKEA
jgi:phage protein D